ncbi:MAG: hypothetical protein ACYDHO_08875, partial [Gaiellaceae bacterium]
CGNTSHSRQSDVAAIKTVITKSPHTYFAFRNRLYWGRPVHFAVARVRISSMDDHFAAARVLALEANGNGADQPQQLLLRRAREWRVIWVTADGPSGIPCRKASAGVVRELVGNCDPSSVAASLVMAIHGPRSNRPPTASERAAIVAVARSSHFKAGQDRCVRYDVRVSRVDDRFASVGYSFVPPYTNCQPVDGESLMERAASGRWRVKGDGSDPFPCRFAPPGVIRSLFSGCWNFRD